MQRLRDEWTVDMKKRLWDVLCDGDTRDWWVREDGRNDGQRGCWRMNGYVRRTLGR